MKNSILKFIYWLLKFYAERVIRRHKPFIIAVTGSVGKTTTKEFIYKILKDEFGSENVRANAGNLNAEIGIPLTILGYTKTPGKLELIWIAKTAFFRTFVKKYPKYLILEMGVERPGDIDYFCSFVKPDIGVVTAATPAHVTNFKDLNEMQSEKIKLIKYSKIGVVNGDDEFIKSKNLPALKYSTLQNKIDCFAENIELSIKGMKYNLIFNNNVYQISNKLLGKQMAYSQLAAFLIAAQIGINPRNIQKSLNSLTAYPGRMNLIEGRDEIIIIDDTYNANPSSSKAAIETLSSIKCEGRKVLIHGNMNELGKIEKEAHFELGKFARNKIDLALFMGPNAEVMQEGFADKEKSVIFSNRKELLGNVTDYLKPNDLVLIKGSQNNNYLEEVTKKLMKDKAQADKILVRQSNNWLRKKR